MKKVVVAILGVIAVAVVVLLIIAATKPDTFRVERSATIKAPPGKIFAFINDFHSWAEWSPFEKLDPVMKRTYSGAPNGLGAMYAWEGNSDAGAGHMEITESTTPSRVVIKLDFLKPFEAHNTAEFILQPVDSASTNVTWAIYGPNLFVGKIMSIFFNMDTVIGKDFETGLANLQVVATK